MRFTVRDDLQRNRLTVFFRLILAIPHFIWIVLWWLVAMVVLPVHWLATLIMGRPLPALHAFYEALVRYTLHLSAFVCLAANPFPGFVGKAGTYPVDFEPMPVEEQGRAGVAFRLFLALPVLLLAGALGSGNYYSAATIVAFLGWFAIMAIGSMPPGLRDVSAYGITYSAQASAYFVLLTSRYPRTDFDTVPLLARPHHPVRMRNADDPARNRLTVFFRLFLAIPHFIWLMLWGIAVYLGAFVGWVAALITGRLPEGLHRFIGAYVRYYSHVIAFTTLAAGPFPGFTGTPGSYPIDIEIDERTEHSRASVFFRIFLALPALFVVGALGMAQYLAAMGAWFYALATGRMPSGLHQLLAYVTRYTAQVNAYVLLLTPRYPHSGPSEQEEGTEPARPPSMEAGPEMPTLSPAPETTSTSAFTQTPEAPRVTEDR